MTLGVAFVAYTTYLTLLVRHCIHVSGCCIVMCCITPEGLTLACWLFWLSGKVDQALFPQILLSPAIWQRDLFKKAWPALLIDITPTVLSMTFMVYTECPVLLVGYCIHVSGCCVVIYYITPERPTLAHWSHWLSDKEHTVFFNTCFSPFSHIAEGPTVLKDALPALCAGITPTALDMAFTVYTMLLALLVRDYIYISGHHIIMCCIVVKGLIYACWVWQFLARKRGPYKYHFRWWLFT